MSEFTDDTLNRYLDQHGMREAALHDPEQRWEEERLRRMLEIVERAMADEGVPYEARRRVINRVVWGEPEGRIDVHARMAEPLMTRDEARDLLLTTFDPSDFDRTPSPVFTEPAGDLGVTDDLKPYAGPVRPDEEPTT